jgi:hypothetical protein
MFPVEIPQLLGCWGGAYPNDPHDLHLNCSFVLVTFPHSSTMRHSWLPVGGLTFKDFAVYLKGPRCVHTLADVTARFSAFESFP